MSFVNIANVKRVHFRSLGAAIYCTYNGGDAVQDLWGGGADFPFTTQI